ncbi:hypothetical protein NL108_007753 [Boleophthalmus pectinirostris]|nr:hypothetical protein NL108_007753 [Boleophthalmus pectinirostris]
MYRATEAVGFENNRTECSLLCTPLYRARPYIHLRMWMDFLLNILSAFNFVIFVLLITINSTGPSIRPWRLEGPICPQQEDQRVRNEVWEHPSACLRASRNTQDGCLCVWERRGGLSGKDLVQSPSEVGDL